MEELGIRWKYPGYIAPIDETAAKEGKDRSLSMRRKEALLAGEAFAYLSGEDRRPLLVLRECTTCTGTEDALMTKGADNEKTMLMSRWFHCVKLPPDVLKEGHPFHALFAGDDPAHLFVARWDGSQRRDLTGAQSRTELWGVMGDILASEYQKKPDKALQKPEGDPRRPRRARSRDRAPREEHRAPAREEGAEVDQAQEAEQGAGRAEGRARRGAPRGDRGLRARAAQGRRSGASRNRLDGEVGLDALLLRCGPGVTAGFPRSLPDRSSGCHCSSR